MTVRVLLTRPPSRSAPLEAALRAEGLDPVTVPAIAVELDPPGGPLDAAASVLHTFDWVVVTSANGARAILTAAERVFTALETPAWAAIGDATAQVLEREGIQVGFRPTRADGRALADELPVRPGQEVLLLRGDLASPDLPRRLRDRGAVVTDLIAYRTIEAPASSRRLLRDALDEGRPRVVLFASGSAARGLVDLANSESIDITTIPAICIGSETAHVAVQLGFVVLATSAVPDPASLASTTVAALSAPVEIA